VRTTDGGRTWNALAPPKLPLCHHPDKSAPRPVGAPSPGQQPLAAITYITDGAGADDLAPLNRTRADRVVWMMSRSGASVALP
jgi:hypothetical protein